MDFLSHATIVGFMGGAATVVILQQLKGILGLEHFTHATDVVSVLRSVFSQTHQVPLSVFESHALCLCSLAKSKLFVHIKLILNSNTDFRSKLLDFVKLN